MTRTPSGPMVEGAFAEYEKCTRPDCWDRRPGYEHAHLLWVDGPDRDQEDERVSNEPLRPYIDMDTLAMVLPPEVLEAGRFTGEQWRNMTMPPCPKCATLVDADRVDVTYLHEKVRHYVFGRWQCPNECDPRTLPAQPGVSRSNA